MLVIDHVLTDRGSKYAVSGEVCDTSAKAKRFIQTLKKRKKFARAAHHSWALLCDEGAVKNDDGESGAGAVILRMLEREDLTNHIIVVTRWYGGKHLGGDRFRHIQSCVNAYLDALK